MSTPLRITGAVTATAQFEDERIELEKAGATAAYIIFQKPWPVMPTTYAGIQALPAGLSSSSLERLSQL